MGSGGGGTSTTGVAQTPDMIALQHAALPQIESMLTANPLSTYAAWSPRQIAGSNPAYDMLFNQASRMGPALNGLNLIFGNSAQDGGGGMAVPSMGGGAGGAGTGVPMGGSMGVGSSMGGQGNITPPPPPNYQPANIADMIKQQVAAQVTPAVNAAAPPRNSIQGNTYYDQYGILHNLNDPSMQGLVFQQPGGGVGVGVDGGNGPTTPTVFNDKWQHGTINGLWYP